MKSIQKLRITNILISTSTVLILAITGCSKKDPVTPSVDMNKSKPLSIKVATVAYIPNSVTVNVSGFDNYQYSRARFQYSLVKKSSQENINDWQEAPTTSRYYNYDKTFQKEFAFIKNGPNAIRASFINGEQYIFRIAYKVPGGGDILFYTKPTEPVTVSTKPKIKPYHDAKAPKSMTITPDFIATNSYADSYSRGIIILNLTELINIDLNNIKSASIATRIASTKSSFNGVEPNSSGVNVTCDHINDSFIIKGLGKGINYDIKIVIDGVERIVGNVKASGTKKSPLIK